MIDAWKARGADRFDPLRFRFIEALARRAAAHQGEVRRLLDARLATLLAAYGEDLEKAAPIAAPPPASPRGALAELADHIARPADGVDELKALGYFRSTWSRLSAERRLTQSLATVPKNAGPLNSQQLVHRSLTLMRELSPEYLERFMSHVDALLWLDQVHSGHASTPKEAPRAARPAKRQAQK